MQENAEKLPKNYIYFNGKEKANDFGKFITIIL